MLFLVVIYHNLSGHIETTQIIIRQCCVHLWTTVLKERNQQHILTLPNVIICCDRVLCTCTCNLL